MIRLGTDRPDCRWGIQVATTDPSGTAQSSCPGPALGSKPNLLSPLQKSRLCRVPSDEGPDMQLVIGL
eukprot:2136014-Rhodomonas_salina.1